MTNYDRALQIWVLLACAAHERTIYTYGGLARKLGIDEAYGVIGQYLGPIMDYCQQHELPPLTILVVNQETGLPGPGLISLEPEQHEPERVRVFAHDWLAMPPPSIDILKKSRY